MVEYGPGTGVYIEAISTPSRTMSAGCLTSVTLSRGWYQKIDAIAYGQTWTAFLSELQDQLLQSMFEVLSSGGNALPSLIGRASHLRPDSGSGASFTKTYPL